MNLLALCPGQDRFFASWAIKRSFRTRLLFTVSSEQATGPDGHSRKTLSLFLDRNPPRLPPLSQEEWWSLSGSNRRPPACKAGALPAELKPLFGARSPVPQGNHRSCCLNMVGPGRFELPTSPLSGVRSNQLSYGPDRPTSIGRGPAEGRRHIQ